MTKDLMDGKEMGCFIDIGVEYECEDTSNHASEVDV